MKATHRATAPPERGNSVHATLRPRRARHSGIVKAHETLEDVERAYVQQVLARSPTLKKAATRLGVHLVTLWRMRKRWGL
jgi:transcriptional regulator with PAS, ATPase and Fis domain